MSAHICGRAGKNIRKGVGVGLRGVGLRIRSKVRDLNNGLDLE